MENKDIKKEYKVNGRLIICLLIGLSVFTIIILTAMLGSGAGNKKGIGKKNNPSNPSTESEDQTTGETKDHRDLLAVLESIDIQNRQVTILDVFSGEILTLSYTGGSDITDKYGQAIVINQLEIGTMVDASYQRDTLKLTKLQISNQAWEYKGVANLTIDPQSHIMKIADTKYKYNDQLLVIDGEQMVSVDHLAHQDELTVRGYKETIHSITVTRGHGTLKLKDYEEFLGAYISVGYEAIQKIAEEMVIVVREGRFNLTVENEDFTASKQVVINRNQETIVSLGDMGPAAQKAGLVTFEINPFGADLFIDGELTSYANPVKLHYGEHKLEVSLGGYTTYRGTIDVQEAGKIVKVDLPEKGSGKEIAVTEEEEIIQPATDPDLNTEDPDQGDDETDITIDGNHRIYVQNPLGASVYIDGEFRGISPVSFDKIIGSHVITFIKDNYKVQSYTLEISNDGKDVYLNYDDLVKLE